MRLSDVVCDNLQLKLRERKKMDFDAKQGIRETSRRCRGNQRIHVSHGEASDVLIRSQAVFVTPIKYSWENNTVKLYINKIYKPIITFVVVNKMEMSHNK
jgi:hypothetical protein